MKCQICKKDFLEKEIHESHDVPCYLFWMDAFTRKGQKQLADKMGRHHLCKECHYNYEKSLNQFLIKTAITFKEAYYNGI